MSRHMDMLRSLGFSEAQADALIRGMSMNEWAGANCGMARVHPALMLVAVEVRDADGAQVARFDEPLGDGLEPAVMAGDREFLRGIPEVAALAECKGNIHHIHDGRDHTLAVVDRLPHDLVLRLGALCHDLGKLPTRKSHPTKGETYYGHAEAGVPIADSMLTRFGVDRKVIDQVLVLVREHMILPQPESLTDKAIRGLITRCGELLDKVLELAEADLATTKTPPDPEFYKNLRARIAEVKAADAAEAAKPKPLVSGEDLKALGIQPGPEMGKILKHASALQAEGKDRAGILEAIRLLFADAKRDGDRFGFPGE